MRKFPSLKLFKTGDNEVVEFKGKNKTLEAFEKFLEKHCRVDVRYSNSLRDKSGKHIKNSDESHNIKKSKKKKLVRDEL